MADGDCGIVPVVNLHGVADGAITLGYITGRFV
jgi:hypothetical protein